MNSHYKSLCHFIVIHLFVLISPHKICHFFVQFQVLSVKIDSPLKLRKQIYFRLKQVLVSPLPDGMCLFW